jgi:hypothetical protein
LSKPNYPNGDENFLGPINIHVTKSGEIYVGSIHDSGWLGDPSEFTAETDDTVAAVKMFPSWVDAI